MPPDQTVRRSSARAWLLAATLPLAACAHRRVEVVPPPAPPALVAAPPPAPRAPTINDGLSPAATVWHLRAALNVAALACRGVDDAVTAAWYNAMLVAQRAPLLAAQTALAAEYRAGGGRWQERYDGAMTRLYNYFSDTPAGSRFCAAAAATLADMQRIDPAALPQFAAGRLPVLDAAVADVPVMPGAAIALAAAPVAAPARRTRLELDLSTLPPD